MSIVFLVLDVSLALSVFAFGLQAQRLDDVRFMLRHPRDLLLSLLAMYVVTPVLALLVVQYVPMPLVAKVALVALSLSMIPPLLPQKQQDAGGVRQYAIGLVLFVAVLAPVGVPLLVDFLGRLMGRPFGLSPWDVSLVVIKLVLLPLLAGLLVGSLWPGLVQPVRGLVPKVAGAMTGLALIALLIATLPATWGLVTSGDGALVVVGALLLNVGALGVGHLMGGPERGRSVVLALACATRHPALALTIGAATFPELAIAPAVIVAQVVNAVVSSWYLRRLSAPSKEPVAAQ